MSIHYVITLCRADSRIKLKKIRAELANLNHCAVPFLSLAAVNFSWYDSTGCSKKTGPAYVFSHPDYNFTPMKLKF